MSSDDARRYLELSVDLILRRGSGPLSQDEEARLAADLDECWWAMSEVEQAEIEAWWRIVPDAPTSLGMEDRVVEIGARVVPRAVVGG